MTEIIVVLNEDGNLDSLLSNTEIDVKVLKRGVNDEEIDIVEATFESVDYAGTS